MKKALFNKQYGLQSAVLEGRKTQTRRLLKHQPSSEDSEMLFYIFDDERYYDNPEKDPLWGSVSWKNSDGTKTKINKVAYLIGEEVAVAQSYFDCGTKWAREHIDIASDLIKQIGYRNKMFVRADLMPHRIKITNIRVERLQDISDEDCLKEGIITSYDECNHRNVYGFPAGNKKVKLTPNWKIEVGYKSPREAYAALIDKVSGKGTWESNPWVFVYDFELVR